MLNQFDNVVFKFSDQDLCAYLITLGYKLMNIEVIKQKRYNDRIKVYIYFQGNKDEFIDIQTKYNQNEIFNIKLQDFSITKQRLKKMIKHTVDIYNGN